MTPLADKLSVRVIYTFSIHSYQRFKLHLKSFFHKLMEFFINLYNRLYTVLQSLVALQSTVGLLCRARQKAVFAYFSSKKIHVFSERYCTQFRTKSSILPPTTPRVVQPVT